MTALFNRPVAGLLLVFFCLTAALSASENIVDKSLGFTLALPEGFLPRADLVGSQKGIIHAFSLGDPNDDEVDTFLMIEDLGGTIGPEPLNQNSLPKDFKGQLLTTTWQGFEVDVFRIPEESKGTEIVNYNVQVPLKRRAIQVRLIGLMKYDQELKNLMPRLLESLQGESNWKSTAPRAVKRSNAPQGKIVNVPIVQSPLETLPEDQKAQASSSDRRPSPQRLKSKAIPDPIANYDAALWLTGGLYVVCGLLLLFVISRNTPPGTTLAISIAVVIAAMTISRDGSKAVNTAAGATKVLGLSGLAIGLKDIFFRNGPQKSA